MWKDLLAKWRLLHPITSFSKDITLSIIQSNLPFLYLSSDSSACFKATSSDTVMYAFRNLVFLIRARHFWQSSVGVIWPCFSAAETCNIYNSKNPLLSQPQFQILHWGRQTEQLRIRFWSKAWNRNQENPSTLHLVQWTRVTTPSAWRWVGGYTVTGQATQLCFWVRPEYAGARA